MRPLWSTLALALILPPCGLALGCASQTAVGSPTELTSAKLVSASREQGASAEAVSHGSYEPALDLADHALVLWPGSPWAHYDRAVALHHLGRVDAAVASYRNAEQAFGKSNRWGTAIAIYGRARALNDVGRCVEARASYEDFARFVQSTDAPAAAMARTIAQACRESTGVVVEDSTTPTAMVRDILARDYSGALGLASGASSPSGWVEYNQAVALTNLGRTDEAIAMYGAAERRFGEASENHHARASAIYGRARALDAAGRCAEATAAYEAYAAFVRSSEPRDADEAMKIARGCKGR